MTSAARRGLLSFSRSEVLIRRNAWTLVAGKQLAALLDLKSTRSFDFAQDDGFLGEIVECRGLVEIATLRRR
jgi:hypothetical protein